MNPITALDSLIASHRSEVFAPPVSDEVSVILMSGGMDSVIASYLLLEETDCRLAPLYVKRSARAEVAEVTSSIFFVDELRNRYPGRVTELRIVNGVYPPREMKRELPAAFKQQHGHPGRNAFLVILGAYYLRNLKAKDPRARTVYICNSPDDTFPHSRLDAIRAMNVAVCIDQDDWQIQVTSPLLEPGLWGEVNKGSLVEIANFLEIPIEKTHTCTASVDPCGECTECSLRLKYLPRRVV